MRPHKNPTITHGRARGEVVVSFDPDDVFTSETLVREIEAMRPHCPTIRVRIDDSNNLVLVLRDVYNDRDQLCRRLADFNYDYVVQAEPEAPEIMFVAGRKGGAIDPKQPLSGRTIEQYFARLSTDWGIRVDDGYLWVSINGTDLWGEAAGRVLRPRYKPAFVHAELNIRRQYIDDIIMVVRMQNEEDSFNLQKVRELPFVGGDSIYADDTVCKARIGGNPHLLTYAAFLASFVTDDLVWRRCVEFAHALGFHPVGEQFAIKIDPQRSMVLKPSPISDRR
jgi:hypothetical protein